MLNSTRKKEWKQKNIVTKMEFKLMKNAIYGKTMEKLKNRIDVKLVRNKNDYLRWTSKPSYMSQKCFTIIWLQFVKAKLHQCSTNLDTLGCVF